MCGRAVVAAALGLLALQPARALGPHEVAVIVNRNSPRSLEVANHFIHLRRIPDQNVVYVALPARVLEPEARLSAGEFTQTIWEPVVRTLRERNLQDHIIAWAYSADFPVGIEADQLLSLTGATLLRNQAPDAEQVRLGRYASMLFAGPGQTSDRKAPSRSLEQFTIALGTNMPLPSMLLGHAGSRGETVAAIIDRLRLTARADGTAPRGEVAFVLSDDVRSTCRAWQYSPVVEELRQLGVSATISSNLPPPSRRLIGLLQGAQQPPVREIRGLEAGSMAEHLTSFAADFQSPGQTKLTEWLRAGAAGSAGTVAEPMAIWTKFPHARFFTHYASGCTMLESFYQSLASPLQLLLVGDPLARPWAKPPGVTLVDLAESGGPVTGIVEFMASTWASPFERTPNTLFLVDGRSYLPSGNQPTLPLDTRLLGDGYHEIRAVAYTQDAVRHQGFDQRGFISRNHGQGIALSDIAEKEEIDLHHARTLTVKAEGAPVEIGLVSRGRIIDRRAWQEPGVVELRPDMLGAGPNRIQAAAWYASNAPPVLGPPVGIVVERLNRAPRIASVTLTNRGDLITAVASVDDPDGDPVQTDWLQALAASPAGWQVSGGSLEEDGAGYFLHTTGQLAVAVALSSAASDRTEILAEMQINEDGDALDGHVSGLIYAYRDPDNFSFFGWQAYCSAWMLGYYQDGKLHRHAARGTRLQPGSSHRLGVARDDRGTIRASVDDVVVLQLEDAAWEGPAGVLARASGLRFGAPLVAPAGAREPVTEPAAWSTRSPALPAGLTVRARDASSATLHPARSSDAPQ